jgi:hypothetical protein
MRRNFVLQQVQVGEDLWDGGGLREGKVALTTSGAYKFYQLLRGDVGRRSASARHFVEWQGTEEASRLQVIYEAGVDYGVQFGQVFKPAADELAAGFADEHTHLWVAIFVVLALYVY